MRKTGKVSVFFACLAAILSAFLLIGCGEAVPELDETGILVDKDGKITFVIVEPFEKEYYTTEGLKAKIEEEIASYEKPDHISVLSVDEITKSRDGGEVKCIKVVMEYLTGGDYQAFNDKACFFGTVEEARNSGYAFEGSFVNTKGEKTTFGLTDLLELKDYKVFIAEEDMPVILPGKVQYMSDGAKQDEKNIRTLNEGLTYVIIK